MQNVPASLRPFVASFAPPLIEQADLQAARAQAWREVEQAEAANPRVLRALRDQQQYEQSQGRLS